MMLISTSWLWAMHQTMSSASSHKSLEGRAISGECDLAISRPCYLNMKKQRFVCRVAHVQMHVRRASICRPSVQTAANCGLLISRRAAWLALIERLNEFQTAPKRVPKWYEYATLALSCEDPAGSALQIRVNLLMVLFRRVGDIF